MLLAAISEADEKSEEYAAEDDDSDKYKQVNLTFLILTACLFTLFELVKVFTSLLGDSMLPEFNHKAALV